MIQQALRDQTTILTIFGAAGDLAWRKLGPALYSLFMSQRLPEKFAVIGVDEKPMTDEEFRIRLRDGVDHFRTSRSTDDGWQSFSSSIFFFPAREGDLSDLPGLLKEKAAGWNSPAENIFYLAVPSAVVPAIVENIGKMHLIPGSRIVIEKPFGRDLDSARALNTLLTRVFDESQIFRIDHYLGKETVQNILAFRFANTLFEPIWDRRYIDHVQITVAEELGVEHRGRYYDQAGALRDMVQNHLLQILCPIAMEPMVSFEADEIRDKKVDVLRAIRPIPPDEIEKYAARGQYDAGWLKGQHAAAYRSEEGVARDSMTETFAALKLYIDNWRWQGVPFYLRTGKRLATAASDVIIQFLPVPHKSFPSKAALLWQPNCLFIRIQPSEGITLRFQAKQPGTEIHLRSVHMDFSYQETFNAPSPDAYETLMVDILSGDSTLFMRSDQEELAWALLEPVLEAWGSTPEENFPDYKAGTWGPESASSLIARDGRTWLSPGG